MAIVERTCFQRTTSSRRVKRFTATPWHDGHRSGNRSVGTSELHPVAHAVALRYVKRPLAKPKSHRAKIQSESRRWPEFARRAAVASKTADARSLGVARRAGRAARRGTGTRGNNSRLH